MTAARRTTSRPASPGESLARLAPFLTLALLVGLSVGLPNRTIHTAEGARRMAEVAATLEAVPRFIGEWTGIDERVPPEAQKLLRPNAILSRIYTRPGGPDVQILVVHCGDARDMIGHYPPVCYPSSGWVQVPVEEGEEDMLRAGPLELPVQAYRFVRVRDRGREDAIRIFSTFVPPDGTATRRIVDIYEQAGRRAVAVQGVAQIQVITDSRVDREAARDAAEEVLEGMDEMLKGLGIVRGGSQS